MVKKKKEVDYLTEGKLYDVLVSMYGSDKVKQQVTLPNKKRVDYMVEEVDFTDCKGKISLVIEFDGYKHYQSKENINRDLINNRLLIKSGYHVIHIPYFVQVQFAIPYYFNTMDCDNHIAVAYTGYPNGFIDDDCFRPIDFSVHGWYRFIYEIRNYPTPIREDIYSTMTKAEHDIFDMIGSTKECKDMIKLYDSVNFISGVMYG